MSNEGYPSEQLRREVDLDMLLTAAAEDLREHAIEQDIRGLLPFDRLPPRIELGTALHGLEEAMAGRDWQQAARMYLLARQAPRQLEEEEMRVLPPLTPPPPFSPNA
jgi:hypothetical protein